MSFWWGFLAGVAALAFLQVVLALAWWLRAARSLPAQKKKPRGEVVHVDAARWRQHGGNDGTQR